MKTEVANLVNYSAKRILDQFLNSTNTLDGSNPFSAEVIFKDLQSGETRDIIFSNLEDFNSELNKLVWNRMEYFVLEGFVTRNGTFFTCRSEEEIEAFANADDDLAF